MGSLLGGKAKSTTNTSTVNLPKWVEGPLKDLMSRANTLSNQAYTPYEGERVAGFTGDELTAQQGIRDMQGAGTSNYDYANELLNLVARTGTDGFSQDYLDQYMNPYQTNVLDVAKNRALDTFSQRMNDYKARAGQIGSFGGSRTALGEAQLAKDFQRQLQENETLGLANNYNQALGAAERGMGRVATAASGLAGLADAEQGYNLRDIQALSGSGQQQRLQNQLGLDTTYENYLQEKQYPYQQLEFLANIGMPMGDLTRGQTNVQTQSGGGGGILSKALGVASMFAAPFTGGTSLMGGLGSLGGIFGGNALSQGALGLASQGGLFSAAEGGVVPFAEGGGAGKPSFEQILMALKQAQEAADGAPIGVQSGDVVYTSDPSYNFQPYDVLDNSEKQRLQGIPSDEDFNAIWDQIYSGEREAPRDLDGMDPSQIVQPVNTPKKKFIGLDAFKGLTVDPKHPFKAEIKEAAKATGLPEGLIAAQMNQESLNDPEALSHKGASGLMQLMPDTAKELGVTEINDPAQNVLAGATYLKKQLDRFGDLPTALAAYNAGPGNVKKAGGIPNFKETKTYVRNILAQADQKYACGGKVKHYDQGGNVYFGDSNLTPFQKDIQGGISGFTDYAVDSGQKGVNDILNFLSYFTESDKQKYQRQQNRKSADTNLDLLQAENRLRSPSGLEAMLRNPLPLYKGQIPSLNTPTKEIKPLQSPVPLENDLYLQDMGVEPPTAKTETSPVEEVKSKFAEQLVDKGTEAKPDKFNYPLFAFGAALLANDSDFFSDLGVAGKAAVNTSRAIKEQEKAEKTAAEAKRQKQILEMFKLEQEDRALDIRQQNADTLAKSSAPSPYKDSIENLKMQLLQKKLTEGPKDDKFRQQLILQAMQNYERNPVESADAIMQLMGGDVGEDPLAASAAEMGLTLQ